QRFIILPSPSDANGAVGPNNEIGPASAPADGPTEENHLHTNPYPNTASPGQTPECEAGNEHYADTRGQTIIGNQSGNQGTKTQDQPKAEASTP
ncbi:MAG: hypothetical protein QOE60_850, partial [Thermoleophilaceae bacterium]|nr:hypothetical protein [Thermoleophilaceae bacterium]